MKHPTRILTATLTVLLCGVTLTAQGTAMTAQSPAAPISAVPDDMAALRVNDRNAYSVGIYQVLHANLTAAACATPDATLTETIYPSYYGGAYIGLDDNRLHIQIVEENAVASYAALTDTCTSMLKADTRLKCFTEEDVVFEPVRYSLQQLKAVQASLTDVMQEYHICMVALDDPNGGLTVALKAEGSKEDVLAYLAKEFPDFSADAITFEGDIGAHFTASDTASNALAGSKAYTSSDNATLGFNAYNASSQKYGVVTAGHFATTTTTVSNSKRVAFGQPAARRVGGTLDAEFIPFTSGNISPSTGISGVSTNLTGYYSAGTNVYGMNVSKKGASTGVTTGVVTSSSANIDVGDISFTDQVKISNRQVGGDSGCPVYTTTNGVNRLVGIATIADGSSNGYASKVSTILSTFGLTLYNG